jgi:hypothetical protein
MTGSRQPARGLGQGRRLPAGDRWLCQIGSPPAVRPSCAPVCACRCSIGHGPAAAGGRCGAGRAPSSPSRRQPGTRRRGRAAAGAGCFGAGVRHGRAPARTHLARGPGQAPPRPPPGRSGRGQVACAGARATGGGAAYAGGGAGPVPGGEGGAHLPGPVLGLHLLRTRPQPPGRPSSTAGSRLGVLGYTRPGPRSAILESMRLGSEAHVRETGRVATDEADESLAGVASPPEQPEPACGTTCGRRAPVAAAAAGAPTEHVGLASRLRGVWDRL